MKRLELGITTFGEVMKDPITGETPTYDERINRIIDEIVIAEKVGLDYFSIGEHHREDFAVSSPQMILAAAAKLTSTIRFGWLNDNDEWMLKELPDLPKKEINSSFQYRKVLFETIGVIVGFSILLIVLRLPWLAFGDDLGDMTIITPSNYNMYFPFLLGLIGFYGFIQLLYLKAQSLTKLVISLRAVLSILIITTFSFMFFGPSVFFLAEDIDSLSNIIGVNMSRLESQINLILGTILVFIVVGRIFDLYKDIKAYKKQSLN